MVRTEVILTAKALVSKKKLWNKIKIEKVEDRKEFGQPWCIIDICTIWGPGSTFGCLSFSPPYPVLTPC